MKQKVERREVRKEQENQFGRMMAYQKRMDKMMSKSKGAVKHARRG